jgi:hypothetical protein
VRLRCDEFEQLHFVGRRGGDAQVTVAAEQQQTGGVGVEHFDTAHRHERQQVDDVEVLDERVGELDEDARDLRFS